MNIQIIADLVIQEATDREKLKQHHPDHAARIYQVLMEVSALIGEEMKKIRRKEVLHG